MNTINKTLLIVVALFGLLFQGCEQNVLDKPPRDIFSDFDVWTDIELTRKFQNTIYIGLRYWAVGNYLTTLAMHSDEAKLGEDLNV